MLSFLDSQQQTTTTTTLTSNEMNKKSQIDLEDEFLDFFESIHDQCFNTYKPQSPAIDDVINHFQAYCALSPDIPQHSNELKNYISSMNTRNPSIILHMNDKRRERISEIIRLSSTPKIKTRSPVFHLFLYLNEQSRHHPSSTKSTHQLLYQSDIKRFEQRISNDQQLFGQFQDTLQLRLKEEHYEIYTMMINDFLADHQSQFVDSATGNSEFTYLDPEDGSMESHRQLKSLISQYEQLYI